MAAPAAATQSSADEDAPIQPKSIKALTSILLKRTFDMFVGNHSQKAPVDDGAQRVKIATKVRNLHLKILQICSRPGMHLIRIYLCLPLSLL